MFIYRINGGHGCFKNKKSKQKSLSLKERNYENAGKLCHFTSLKLLPVESTIIKHNTSKLKRKQSKFGLPVALSPSTSSLEVRVPPP